MSILTLNPSVGMVVGFDEDTPAAALETLAPDVLFKGPEYRGTDIPGAQHCGRVVFLEETPGFRTTEIEKRVAAHW